MLFPERPITIQHVRAFCAKFSEGYRVKYKRNFDANVREKVPRVLASFANSHGGALVVGVNTLNGVPQPPFEGFQPPVREELPLTVENICLQNVYPTLLPRTTVVESDVGEHIFLVIEIDESAQAPHAVENSTRVYIRTGNAANPYDLANVDQIFDLAKRRKEPFELRARLIERAKTRFGTHIGIKHATDGADVGTLLRLSIGPRFPTRQLCPHETLTATVLANTIRWRGVQFPSPRNNILSQHESAVVLDAIGGTSTSIFEVNVWGLLFYAAQISVPGGDTAGIGLSAFLGYTMLLTRHAANVLQSLGYSGPVTIEIVLSAIRGVPWLQRDWTGSPEVVGSSRLDDEAAIEVPTATETLLTNPDHVAAQIFRSVFFSVNCSDLADTDDKLEQLVVRGYEFNNWQRSRRTS